MRLHNIKTAMISVLFIILAASICFAEGDGFRDMSGHWAEVYVSALAEKGLISGMPDGLFHPNEKMTFPQFVTIIITVGYGKQEPVDSYWASGYMKTALENGLIVPDDMEKTEDITRYDAARLISNALDYILEEEAAADIMIEPDFADFTDCRLCQTNYSYARICRVKGIVTGRPSPEGLVFEGSENLTRAEGCIMIMKMLAPELRTLPE